jgi:iron complex outermembrane recepter protein
MYLFKLPSNKKLSRIALALSCSFSVLHGPLSVAQENSETAEELEIITVKSDLRVKRVQDIPNSMTALSADKLDAKAVTRMDDLQFASPGLTITDAGLTQSVNIRGIGLASGDPDVTNGVGTYIDGLFQPPIVSTMDFYDVGYIQVLRGPQGTFAGANSTGGAILIETKRPDVGGDFSGYAKLSAGNYAYKGAEAALNLPLTDTLAARVAVNYKNRDSYYDSVGTEQTDAGSQDENGARIGLLWAPMDNLSLYLKYETADKDSGGYAYRPIEGTANSAGRTADIRKLSYNSPTANDEQADTLLLDVKYQLDSGVNIKWLSGKQTKEITNLYDVDGTTLAGSTRYQYVKEDQVSHEFNIISPDSDSFEWVVGAYYQKNEVLVDINNGPFPTEIDISNEKTIKGLFGQVGYHLTEDLQIEAGLRKVKFEAWVDPTSGVVIGRGIPNFPPNGVKVATIDGDYNDDDMVGKVSLNWAVSDDSNLYAYVAKGYKPGGINSSTSTFEPEKVVAYEAGWKGALSDRNVNGSVSVFYNSYDNFQNNNIDITTGRSDVYNIAEATIKGIELAFDARFDMLVLDASFSYIDSSLNPTAPIVDSRALGAAPNVPQCGAGQDPADGLCFDYTPFIVSANGGPNLYAPESSFTLGAEYLIELSNGATLTPRINYAWIDDQWTTLLYDEDTDLLKSRGLMSAMLTYEQDSWKVQLYGRNILDKEYVSGQTGDNNEFYGAPRVFGVDVTYQF